MIIDWNGYQYGCFVALSVIIDKLSESKITHEDANELLTQEILDLLRSLSSEQVEKLFNAV